MPEETTKHPSQRVNELFQQVTAPLDGMLTGASGQYADTLLCISSEAALTYGQLWQAATDKKLPYAALLTRNLLELAIWTEYCATSEVNAKRFVEDTVRDLNGLLAALQKICELAPTMPSNLESMCTDAAESVKRMAALAGIQELDSQCQRVRHAASEISRETGIAFTNLNTIFSKFIHPTSWSVKHSLPPETTDQLCSGFLQIGTPLMGWVLIGIAKAVQRIARS